MPSNKNVLFLVPYPLHRAPSQRFRVELFERYLSEAGIKYKIAPFLGERTWRQLYQGGNSLGKVAGVVSGFLRRTLTVLFEAYKYDYVFVHREAAPLGPPVFEWFIAQVLRKKIIYDFDDAIWIPNTTEENKIARALKAVWKVKSICRWAYKVAAGNSYLAQYASQVNRAAVVVPTCVDMRYGHNQIKVHGTGMPVVGWTGSHSTLPYLNEVMPVLRDLQERHPFEFVVIANEDPQLKLNNYRFIPWQEATETQDLLQIDIGIMPLTEDRWSEGKCGFKLIQYLSLGIPAVASPVGVNKEIIDEGLNGFLATDAQSWADKLELLLTDRVLRITMGERGRQKIREQYSAEANLEKFLKLFS